MLYELFKLLRNTREMLWEVLVDAEVVATDVEVNQMPEDLESLQVFSKYCAQGAKKSTLRSRGADFNNHTFSNKFLT